MKSPLVTRRDFLKNSTLALASLPLIDTLAAEPNRKIGFALCGLGSLSTNQIAPAFQKTQFCRLAGIVTGTPAKAARWKSQYDIPDHCIYNYDTMTQMADIPTLTWFMSSRRTRCMPNGPSRRPGRASTCSCEKPMEVSVEKCQQMIDACREAKRLLASAIVCILNRTISNACRLAREKSFRRIEIH